MNRRTALKVIAALPMVVKGWFRTDRIPVIHSITTEQVSDYEWRVTFYGEMIERGCLSRNDVRRLEMC